MSLGRAAPAPVVTPPPRAPPHPRANCAVDSDRALRAGARALRGAGGARADGGRVRGLRRRPAGGRARAGPRAVTRGRPPGGAGTALYRPGRAARVPAERPFPTAESLVLQEASLPPDAQSVDSLSFALEMLAKHFVHKSCKERRCLVPLAPWAASVNRLG